MMIVDFIDSLIVERSPERLVTTNNACEVVTKFNDFLKGVSFHELTKESLVDLNNTIKRILKDAYGE